MKMEWMRMRVTPTLQRITGYGPVRLLLAERSDGGVFYMEIPMGRDSENDLVWDSQLQNALFQLDLKFLDAPLVAVSKGQFEKDPPVWI